MSFDTKEQLERAIAAHIADECDGQDPGAFVLVTETTDLAKFDRGDSGFFIEIGTMQSSFTTSGLLQAALNVTAGSRRSE